MTTETTDTEPTPITDELSIRRRKSELGADIATLMRDIYGRAKEYTSLGVSATEWLPIVSAHLPPGVGRVITMLAPYLSVGLDYVLTMTPAAALSLDPSSGPKTAALAAMYATAIAAGERSRSEEDASAKLSIGEVDGGAPHALSMPDARQTARRLLAFDPVTDAVMTGTEKSRWDLENLQNLAACFAGYDNEWEIRQEDPSASRMRDVVSRLFEEASEQRGNVSGEDADQAPSMEATVVLRGLQQPLSGSLSTTPEGGLRLMTPMPDKGGNIIGMAEQFFDVADLVAVMLQRKVTTQTAKPVSNIILSPS